MLAAASSGLWDDVTLQWVGEWFHHCQKSMLEQEFGFEGLQSDGSI
jgi:hypothetical protein